MTWWQILLIVLAVLVVVWVVLYFVGKKMQTKVDTQQAMINDSKQLVQILVIDKKKMKLQESNLPQMVQDQIPWYLKWRKMPLVKAKIGPKIATLMCENSVFEELPVKQVVRVELAGIFITSVKSKSKKKKGAKNDVQIKKSWIAKTRDKANNYLKKNKKTK